MTAAVDRGPASFQVRGFTGDHLTIVVLISDFTTGAWDFTGATITATAGGVSFTAAAEPETTSGRLELTFTAAQTTALGDGLHDLVVATTDDGVRQTWVKGTLHLSSTGSTAPSTGAGLAVVNNAMVGIG